MARLISFTNVTLDGFFADPNGDMQFFHQQDAEWQTFTNENASGGGSLLFGRKTYEMMAAFWPTPLARERMPQVATKMNSSRKFVASRTLEHAPWENTTLLNGDLLSEVRKVVEAGPDVVILGSGSIVAQLAAAGMVDELTLAVHPVVLGRGKPLFAGVKEQFSLALAKTRTFKNGNVVLTYVPAR